MKPPVLAITASLLLLAIGSIYVITRPQQLVLQTFSAMTTSTAANPQGQHTESNAESSAEVNNTSVEHARTEPSFAEKQLHAAQLQAEIDAETADWARAHGYHLNAAIDAEFTEDANASHPYAGLSEAELHALAETDDPDAQVIYGARLRKLNPDAALVWLEKASVNSNYTNSINMIGELRMASAYATANANSSTIEQTEAYNEALAWHMVAAQRNDYQAKAYLEDQYKFSQLPQEQQQHITELAAQRAQSLETQHLNKGYAPYSNPALPAAVEQKIATLKRLSEELATDSAYQ